MAKKEPINLNDFVDSDADGLSDQQEKSLGTNPLAADTDKDQLPDYQEVMLYGTNPTNPDTDQDGISDGLEVKMGRNPKGPGLLKDLFIPHSGNNYQPQVLAPKRLLFHALSLVIIKLIVFGAIVLLPLTAWLTPDALIEQGQKIIQLTNNLRNSLGIESLSENFLLNQAAYKKAEDMLLKQYFAHLGPEGKQLANWLKEVKYPYRVAGENLAIGFASAEEVVGAWTKSKTHYDNLIDPAYSEIGIGLASGLYNNYQTTLVAQYFGAPKQSVLAGQPTLAAEPPVQIAAEPTLPATPDQSVSGQQIGDQANHQPALVQLPVVADLAAPSLVFPADNFQTNNPLVSFSVFAPAAEELMVLSNQKEIAKGGVKADYFNDQVVLEEGLNKLVFVAKKGDQSTSSPSYLFMVDQTPPIVDWQKTKVSLVETPSGAERILSAEAYLSIDTLAAEIQLPDQSFSLQPVPDELTKWSGQWLISKQAAEKLFSPAILPVLVAEDKVGNRTTLDIDWEKIEPLKASFFQQYAFAKDNQLPSTKNLFDLSGWYYRMVLAISIIALLLNVFIEIRKQHPEVIFSTLGLIGLLVMLIVV